MFILETLNFVVDILKVPAILVGLIALIGLVAQKKSFSDVVKGTIKTILGFIVLGGGATVLVGSLNPLGSMFEHAFNIQGIIPNMRLLFLLRWKNMAHRRPLLWHLVWWRILLLPALPALNISS